MFCLKNEIKRFYRLLIVRWRFFACSFGNGDSIRDFVLLFFCCFKFKMFISRSGNCMALINRTRFFIFELAFEFNVHVQRSLIIRVPPSQGECTKLYLTEMEPSSQLHLIAKQHTFSSPCFPRFTIIIYTH